MKTTIEIADPVLAEAKAVAAREGTTLRELVESALRRELAARAVRQPFTLRDASVGGSGLAPEFRGKSMQEIIDASYESRGA
jgi:Arc/MetJ family transcription regulator